MRTRGMLILLLVALAAPAFTAQAQRAAGVPPPADRAVYLDREGVVRWSDDRQEVTLFGANYVHAERKRMIDEDMAHFARMGWDGLRLTFWGDWEASDSAGNLIANDHPERSEGLRMTRY